LEKKKKSFDDIQTGNIRIRFFRPNRFLTRLTGFVGFFRRDFDGFVAVAVVVVPVL
jgi:hypothetical protein